MTTPVLMAIKCAIFAVFFHKKQLNRDEIHLKTK